MYWLDRSSYNTLNGLNRLLHEIDRNFTSSSKADSNYASYPKINVWKNDNAVRVSVEVPGIDPSEIDVNARANKLVISGEVKRRDRADGDAYQRSERSSGKFHRELALPYRINPETVSAVYKNGILNIILERADEDKPKKITVKAA